MAIPYRFDDDNGSARKKDAYECTRDEKNEDEEFVENNDDASLMLDYELGETSMQYFLDDGEDVDAGIGPSKLMSGN